MRKITTKRIQELLETKPKQPAVTIYLPTHRVPTPPHVSENKTRFKNLSSQAVDILEEKGKDQEFITFFKDKTTELLDENPFWTDLTESVLFLVQPDSFTYYHLPIDSDEYVAVDDHFHVAPLLGLLNDMQEFYVLSVTQHNPFLMKGDAYGLEDSGLELPKSVEEALKIDEMHLKSTQYHSMGGGNGAQYHGHGGSKDSGQHMHEQFLRIINDHAYHHVDKKKPLILLGTDEEVADFKHIATLPNIVQESIDGSYSKDNGDAMIRVNEAARDIIREHVVEPARSEVLSRLKEVKGRNKNMVEDKTTTIKGAALNGNVDTLLLAFMRFTTDTVRDQNRQVAKLAFDSYKSSLESLNELAELVFKQGGKIVNMYMAKMPTDSPAIAINRYQHS